MTTIRIIAAATGLALALAGCSGGEPTDDLSPATVETTSSDTDAAPSGTASEDAADGSADGSADGATDEPSAVTLPADLPDPCALLSAAEIEAVAGIAFGDGVPNASLSTDTQSICDYAPTDAAFPVVQVLVAAYGDLIAEQRASADQAFGETDDVDVPGASDAFAVAQGAIVGMAVDTLYVQVSYLGPDEIDVTDTTVALATTTVGHL